ncbi:hypothetical protein C5167_046132 [Papaver somniferum]|uniref:Uncharacterized protein n=1 Tax=Papaver somniferum TaxID=3469 RepID=A0A4Y7LGE2_PAPSO|nr:uncharacterized protein LOC113321490 [Papaver somniferum]RZC83351.1 hypothetical protein C5167_046132 [Papaver somniferum]
MFEDSKSKEVDMVVGDKKTVDMVVLMVEKSVDTVELKNPLEVIQSWGNMLNIILGFVRVAGESETEFSYRRGIPQVSFDVDEKMGIITLAISVGVVVLVVQES